MFKLLTLLPCYAQVGFASFCYKTEIAGQLFLYIYSRDDGEEESFVPRAKVHIYVLVPTVFVNIPNLITG